MRRAKLALALASLLSAAPAAAMPFHGCTFWRSEFTPQSIACASFQAIYGGCKKYKCFPGGCIIYDGVLFFGWMPDHFVEVTNRVGESVFAGNDGPLFVEQMALAKSRWPTGDFEKTSSTQEHKGVNSETSMFYARTLPVPYGTLGWSMITTGVSEGGVPYPTCFSAVSEFAPETWLDNALLSGDRGILPRFKPVALQCMVNSVAMGAMSTVPILGIGHSSSSSCARPLLPVEQSMNAQSGSAGRDPSPTKQCMGALGPLLPRSGWTDGNSYTAAERVAWRIASLAEDYFGSQVGVLGDDKWQLIWPISMTTGPDPCFRPGSIIRPVPYDSFRRPGYDDKRMNSRSPETEYVFAIWRLRTSCLEPIEEVPVQAEIRTYSTVHGNACRGLNASMGLP